jgi:hypothetical protein
MLKSAMKAAFTINALMCLMGPSGAAASAASGPTALEEKVDALSGQVAGVQDLLRQLINQTPQTSCYGRRAQADPAPQTTNLTPGPTGPPTPGPTGPPTPGPTGPPTPGPTGPPTSPELTHQGDFEISASDDCAEKTKELQTYSYVKGNIHIHGSNCISIELNLLKGIKRELAEGGGWLGIYENSQLSTFNAPQLKTIDAQVEVTRNPQLGTFSLDALEKIGADPGRYAGNLVMMKNKVNHCTQRLKDICTSTIPYPEHHPDRPDLSRPCYIYTLHGSCN